MKNTIIILTVFCAFAACKKSVSKPPIELEVTKTAVWTIAPVADYSQPYYNNSTAEVKLAVARQFQNPYREVVIWDTTFVRRPISQFMQLNPYIVTKAFPGLKDSKDKITVGYSISYVTGPVNAQQSSAYGAVAEPGNSTHRVNVNL